MSISNQQEAVMSNSVPATHPAVVLRSQYRNLRSLAAVLAVAVIGLTTTVVIQAVDESQPVATTATSTHPVQLSDPFQGRVGPVTQSIPRSYPTIDDSFQSQVEMPRPESKPDESKVAAAIGSGSSSTSISRPDEAKIAAELSQHSEVGPVARAKAYQEALRTMTPEQLERAYGVK
jgi:hypothetical protein